MPRTSEQFKEVREKSKEHIIKTALYLFAERGFYSTSISMIAKEAGIAKGALYHYFDSKEDLLKAIIEMGMGKMGHAMEVLFSNVAPMEKLEGMVRTTVALIEDDPLTWKLMIALTMQQHPSETMKEIVAPLEKKGTEFFFQMFKDLNIPHPEEEGYVLAAILDGLAMHLIFKGEDHYPVERVVNHVLDRYRSMVKK
ncbi:TetR/AcrR family transcriptional regulator [Algivirga pacifica]|uniref:TetR/AcrR family transcriptional regulator n=1 Tax=Algivirga pacifica TaxID=1162670 RepID=A0ABP9D113_9BACT